MQGIDGNLDAIAKILKTLALSIFQVIGYRWLVSAGHQETAPGQAGNTIVQQPVDPTGLCLWTLLLISTDLA